MCLILSGCVSPGSTGREDLTLCRAGWNATESGDNERALGLFERCIAEGHLSQASLARTHRNIGVACRRKGEPAKAIESFDRALALSPRDPWDDYMNRGNSWSDAGDFDKALADYQRALDARPDYDQAIYNRGIVYERLGQKDKAYADFKRAYGLGLRSALEMDRLRTYEAQGFGATSNAPAPDDPLAQLGTSYKIGPARAAKKIGGIWQNETRCGGGLAVDELSRLPDGDSIRAAGVFVFPSGGVRVTLPELPYLETLDVRVQLNDRSRGVRDDYLTFSDAPMGPAYAAVVRTEMPPDMHGHADQIHDSILRVIDQLSTRIPKGEMVVHEVDGPWGKLVEVLVLNRAGSTCFPTSDYHQLPPGAPGATVGVSRFIARPDSLIEIALIVRIPKDLPKSRHGEYAREQMDQLMGSISVS